MFGENMLEYPQNEQVFYKRNNEILNEWNKYISDKKIIDGYNPDSFVTDGFYPYYYSQKIKILYIAKESRGLSGCDYIETLYDAYKENQINNLHIDNRKRRFHNRMFRITYGIEHGFLSWDEIPCASELTQDFATKNGISFAFMELSKFSNETEHFATYIPLVNNFIEISKNEHRNFWNDQIRNLDPDIIITMRLLGSLNALGPVTVIDNKKYPREYSLNVGEKDIKIIDTYHFSYWKEDPNKCFYRPIIDIVRKM